MYITIGKYTLSITLQLSDQYKDELERIRQENQRHEIDKLAKTLESNSIYMARIKAAKELYTMSLYDAKELVDSLWILPGIE